jgi:sec-independent protein translocase protein TatB
MEVFGVGPFELLLVVIIGFLVLGPERIPGVMRSLGQAIRQVRKSIQQITTDSGDKINVADDLAALRREVLGLQKDLTKVTQGILPSLDQLVSPKDLALTPPNSTATTPTATSDDSDIVDLGASPKV